MQKYKNNRKIYKNIVCTDAIDSQLNSRILATIFHVCFFSVRDKHFTSLYFIALK